jgi:hypothetical protein
MWSPTLLFDRRAYGPEKLSSVTQKDFCNTIDLKQTSRDRFRRLLFGLGKLCASPVYFCRTSILS